jgi:hypothetical protein
MNETGDDFLSSDAFSEETFDELIERVLNTDTNRSSSNEDTTWALLRTTLMVAGLVAAYNDYSINQCPAYIQLREDHIVYPHDIVPNDYDNITVIPYIDFCTIIRENDLIYRNILTLKRKDNSFNVSVIPYSNDSTIFEKLYGKNNIAVYFIPNTIKRLAGKAALNGKDIIRIYSDRLEDEYGYKINSNRIEHTKRKRAQKDAESIIKALKIINDGLYE